MTWDEFKAYVDFEIRKQGKSGSIEIHVIDISYPDTKHERTTPCVSADICGLHIS